MIADPRKAAVVGVGYVGAATAFALARSGLFSELVLINRSRERAEAEALDIRHGTPYARPVNVYAGDWPDLAGAAVVLIAAGAPQREGQTRLELCRENVQVLAGLLPHVTRCAPGAVLLLLTNPVDVLTYAAAKLTGLPEGRVIGTGTVLDTARLKSRLGQELRVDSRGVHAYVIGEHGDSELAAWTSASVSGVPLRSFCALRGIGDYAALTARVEQEVRRSAYEIIRRKGATCFGVAMAAVRICEAIVRDEKSVLPVSCVQRGLYGIEDTALSLPAVVGAGGAETIVPIELSEREANALRASAETLREAQQSVL